MYERRNYKPLKRFAIVTAFMALTGCASAPDPYALPKATPETTIVHAVGEGGNGSFSLRYHHEIVADMSYSIRGRTTGVMEGSFTVAPPPVDDILAEAKLQRFEELPTRIEPSVQPIHAGTYRLAIRGDQGMHEVTVYCPLCMERSTELDRFWAVWDTVWQPFKLQPTDFPRYGPPGATGHVQLLPPPIKSPAPVSNTE